MNKKLIKKQNFERDIPIDLPLPPLQEGYHLEFVANGSNTRVFRCVKDDCDDEDASVVLKCVSHKQGQHNQACSNLEIEHQMLSQFSHENINQSYEFQIIESENGWEHCTLQLRNCKSDLYKQIKQDFPTLRLHRHLRWLAQTSAALHYLHSICSCGHFDLKPENIAISKKGNAKLIDFGFSFCYSKELNQNIKKLWRNRSKLYLAPEMLPHCANIDKGSDTDLSKIQWEKLDVFALAVTFFSCIFYKSPLESGLANKQDPLYQHIMKGDFKAFWKQDQQVQSTLDFIEGEYGQQTVLNIKNFFERALHSDPKQRISFQEIIMHPLLERPTIHEQI